MIEIIDIKDAKPDKLDITPQLAIAAYNTLVDYCNQTETGSCEGCIFDQIYNPETKENLCDEFFYYICPADWEKIKIPSFDGNTITHIKDGQIRKVTCGRKEEAQEFYEEGKHVQE